MLRRFGNMIGPMIAIFIPSLLYVILQTIPTMDFEMVMPKGHFYIVTVVSFLSAIIAIMVGIAGSRLRNIKVIFLSLGYISLALVFTVHGLSTPGLIMKPSNLTAVAAELSVLLAVFWIWLSSLTSDNAFINFLSRWQKFLIPVWTLFLAILGTISLLNPHIVDFMPLGWVLFPWIAAGITIMLNLFTIYRYYQSYSYSRFPLQISIVYSSGWLIVAQVIIVSGMVWWFSWWLYHYLLFGSMIVMLVGLFRQYVSRESWVSAIKSLFTTDPAERIAYSISPSVKSLVMATEARDTYTAGHNFRVTLYALKLAEKMKFSPEQLRTIVQGTIVHDAGKINIPDRILNKPSKLTAEERSIIETHPVKGYEMCRNLGFMKEELDIIRSHHEKWDGSGYPDHLKGKRIPLMARVVAVADVYDALTSSRSYREAWTHDRVMSFLDENKGIHFDPECVEAWQALCVQDPEVYRYPLNRITDQGIILESNVHSA